MSCLLCVESLPDVTSSLKMNSTEAEELNAKNIIEQHFLWLKLDEADNDNNRNCICSPCWQALWTFHEFYERVTQAHKSLTNQHIKPFERYDFVEQPPTVPFAEAKLDEIEIKLEPECTIMETTEKPKRGRGRPSRNQVAGTAISELPIKNAKIESNNQSDNDNAMLNNKASTSMVTTPKRGKPKDWLNTEQSDKFIAEHFYLSCCLCNVPLQNFKLLQKHFQSEHKMAGYVICCDKKIHERGIFVDHLRLHEDPSYFKCDRCNEVFDSRNSIEQHMKKHERVSKRKYNCKECSKTFDWLAVYKRHMLLHTPEEAKNVPCPECKKTFISDDLMNRHLKIVHLNAYGLLCDICAKSLPCQKALREHMEKHAGLPKPIIQCEDCGLKLTSKYGLKQHIKFMHKGKAKSSGLSAKFSTVVKHEAT